MGWQFASFTRMYFPIYLFIVTAMSTVPTELRHQKVRSKKIPTLKRQCFIREPHMMHRNDQL